MLAQLGGVARLERLDLAGRFPFTLLGLHELFLQARDQRPARPLLLGEAFLQHRLGRLLAVFASCGFP